MVLGMGYSMVFPCKLAIQFKSKIIIIVGHVGKHIFNEIDYNVLGI